MLTEKHIRFAHYNILPLGYKPEDYYGVVPENLIKKIAILIAKEALHLAQIEQQIKNNNIGKRIVQNLLYLTPKLGTKLFYKDLFNELKD